jgi:hypothetical protein
MALAHIKMLHVKITSEFSLDLNFAECGQVTPSALQCRLACLGQKAGLATEPQDNFKLPWKGLRSAEAL